MKKLVLSTGAALGMAVAAPPVKAQEPTPAPAAVVPAAVTKAEFDALTKSLDSLRAEVMKLKEQGNTTDAALFGKKDGTAGSDGMYRRLNAMEEKLTAVQETLKKLDDKLTAMTKTTSASSPLSGGVTPSGGAGDPNWVKPQQMPSTAGATPTVPTPANPNAGTIRIVNEYPAEISLVINRTMAYKLAAGEVKAVEVPQGSYTYELLMTGAQPTTSTIKAGETVTLRIK